LGVTWRWIALLLLLAGVNGCFAPVSPMQRVSDAARDLNVSTRFGKMDLIASHVDANLRADFVSRRSQWGKEIRLVDIDLSGVQVQDSTHAAVTLDVSWVPLRDDILRATRIVQYWEDDGRGWRLVREQKLAGDPGLFGEVFIPRNESHPDVHLPTRTLGAHESAP
jgi:hypothetical protein